MKARVTKRFIDKHTLKNGVITGECKTYEPGAEFDCSQKRFAELEGFVELSEATDKQEDKESENNSYELRKLQASDVFPMFKIISKIGISEFQKCFASEEVKKLISDKESEADASTVGFTVVLEIANVVISNVPKAEQEIYGFLSSLSGLSKKETECLDLGIFAKMIVDVFKKEEFRDFIGVVSELFN